MFFNYGYPFSYRKVAISTYPSIQYGNELTYLCKPIIDEHKYYDIFLIICSSSVESDIRNLLRSRLSNLISLYHIGYTFVLGSNQGINTLIYLENEINHDILQLGHNDSYHNLTLSVFSAIQFLSSISLQVKYFMKTDSDCVFNMDKIIKLIKTATEPYIGNCRYNSFYFTDLNDTEHIKQYVPGELVLNDTVIPPYGTGAGYLIKGSILPHVAIAIRHLNFLAHNEDVNIGKAMHILGHNCTFVKHWIARNGCKSKSACSKYTILHKRFDNNEIPLLWDYFQ